MNVTLHLRPDLFVAKIRSNWVRFSARESSKISAATRKGYRGVPKDESERFGYGQFISGAYTSVGIVRPKAAHSTTMFRRCSLRSTTPTDVRGGNCAANTPCVSGVITGCPARHSLYSKPQTLFGSHWDLERLLYSRDSVLRPTAGCVSHAKEIGSIATQISVNRKIKMRVLTSLVPRRWTHWSFESMTMK